MVFELPSLHVLVFLQKNFCDLYTFVWVCMHHCAMNVQHADVNLFGSYVDDTFGCVLVWVFSNVVDTSIGMFTYLFYSCTSC